MIFPTYLDLIKNGFNPVATRVLEGQLPNYLGLSKQNIQVIAKHCTDNLYEIHAAVDSSGNNYDTNDINGNEKFDRINSINAFISFLINKKTETKKTIK
jgi:hypothetical protein